MRFLEDILIAIAEMLGMEGANAGISHFGLESLMLIPLLLVLFVMVSLAMTIWTQGLMQGLFDLRDGHPLLKLVAVIWVAVVGYGCLYVLIDEFTY